MANRKTPAYSFCCAFSLAPIFFALSCLWFWYRSHSVAQFLSAHTHLPAIRVAIFSSMFDKYLRKHICIANSSRFYLVVLLFSLCLRYWFQFFPLLSPVFSLKDTYIGMDTFTLTPRSSTHIVMHVRFIPFKLDHIGSPDSSPTPSHFSIFRTRGSCWLSFNVSIVGICNVMYIYSNGYF